MSLPPDLLDPGDPRPAIQRALRAWLEFQRHGAFEPEAAVAALKRADGPRDALAELRGHASPQRTPATVLDAAVAALRASGAGLLPFSSPRYPWRLAQLRDPAPVLAVRGDASVLSRPAVAIVGARAATVYGRGVARRLACELAAAGLVVVSGLARGIDAAAHEGALAAGGVTVAVQACGIDRVYPAAHRCLAARIARDGAVVSELPPGAPPRKAHFPLRNRLITGLSRALVVVEARLRSGSLVSARHALDQGIEVLAVPGPIDAPTSEGSNRLLRDGAAPVLDAGDVLGALGFAAAGARLPRPALAPRLRAIVAALEREPASRDDLVHVLSRAPGELALELLELELDGRIAEDRDGRWRVVP